MSMDEKMIETMKENMEAVNAALNSGASDNAVSVSMKKAAPAGKKEKKPAVKKPRQEPPRCSDARVGCFGCRGGQCGILDDSDFGGKPCPFYKTRQEVYDGRAKAYVKLKKEGRQDLIDTYGSKVLKSGDSTYLAAFADAEDGTYAREVYDEYSASIKEARYARAGN